MPRITFRPLKDQTVINALRYLRATCLRDGAPGLEHVDALLRLRGVNPASLPIPRKKPKHFRRGELRRAILTELRGGPLTLPELAARVGDGLSRRAAYQRTYQALQKMEPAGLVVHEGRLWGLPGRR